MRSSKPLANLNAEQLAAVELMRSGANVFLSGGGGTGKSTIIETFVSSTTRKCLLVAPTGIAASRINGATIHRTFGFRQSVYLPTCELQLQDELIEDLAHYEVLVIDEISMVRADFLDTIDRTLQQVHGNDLPFGGIQVILVGDLYQLSPIADERSYPILKQAYTGIFPFDAHCWERGNFQPVILNQIHRQSDPYFVNFLNALRVGDVTDEALEEFNRKVKISFYSPPHSSILCANNFYVDLTNRNREARLPAPSYFLPAKIQGLVDFDDLPVSEILELKLNSRIIMVANKQNSSGGYEYTNGNQGTVYDFYITDDGDYLIEIILDDGRGITVERSQWQNKSMRFDPITRKIEEKIIGTCYQYPLKLGPAISIHKSQGLSLDKVHLNLGLNRLFAAAMLYVALSRCRTLEGLSLSRKLWREDIRHHASIAAFYARIEQGGSLGSQPPPSSETPDPSAAP